MLGGGDGFGDIGGGGDGDGERWRRGGRGRRRAGTEVEWVEAEEMEVLMA